jgi:hypothetical protein
MKLFQKHPQGGGEANDTEGNFEFGILFGCHGNQIEKNLKNLSHEPLVAFQFNLVYIVIR